MINVWLCVSSQHDWRLVILAALICLPATLVTFFLYAKVPPFPTWKRWTWLAMTGLVAGSGIWTTHFVAMLAFKTGLPVGYAEPATMGSLLVAVVSTTLGFAIGAATRREVRPARHAMSGGLLVGLGVTLMHYAGMSGYRTTGVLEWNPAYVVASVTIGALLGGAALFVARPGSTFGRQAVGAALLSLAIVGMHFTGMTAVTIIPDPNIVVPAAMMSNPLMAVIAVAITVLILFVAVGAVAFDAASRDGNLRRLREALDVMPEGLAFYDAFDRLLAWNARYADLCQAGGATLMVGLSFSDLLDQKVEHGNYPDALGRECAWIAERKAARSRATSDLIQQTRSGRWQRVTERRTAEGGTVCVSVDITDLKAREVAMAAARDYAEEQARRADAAETVAGLGHWRIDTETKAVTWSPQMYRIYGFAVNGPLDLDAILAMTHPDDVAETNARLERQFAHGERDENSMTRIVTASGEVRFLLGSSDVEHGPDGRITAVFGTVVDVTEQKMAEAAVAESEERFRRLAVNAPDMIAESRLDGVMTYVSPASLAITGFTPEELIGQTFISMMDSEDGLKIQDMCRTVFESRGKIVAWPVEFRTKHKSGRDLWLECRPTLAVDPVTGRFTGLNDVVKDITARKALEAQLRQAQAEAEAAAAVKAEFLANMSHELRTPLTSILGFTSLAAEQTDLTDLTRNYVDRVGDASRALLCTVNDILDFSKLEAGQVSIHREPVSLSKLARATLDLFMPQAGAKDLDLVFDGVGEDDGLVVSADPNRIRQILLNLVSNAVKFTALGSVTLRVRYDHPAQCLMIEVIDTGGGIPPDKQDKLFKRFSQIDGSLTRVQGGTGLGLAICKGLVEVMGGEIGVESAAGEGSRFWFKIPAPMASDLKAANDLSTDQKLSFVGVRVLIVDDHPANRELATLFLTGVGAEIAEAANGEEAVRLASSWPYDVILMDVRMPKLDGPGALRRIRQEEGPNDATPILAFTADADIETEQLLALGFEGVVAKPLEPLALISAIGRAVAFEQAQDQEVAHVG